MDLSVGQTYSVTVIKLLARGIVVQLTGTSQQEFIHISKLSEKFVSNVSDAVKIGDTLDAMCVKSGDRVELSLKHLNLVKDNQSKHKSSKSLDEMIASANASLKDKQGAMDSRFHRKRKHQ